LIGEVAILLIFDVGVFSNPAANIQSAAINPINAFRGFEASGDLAAGAAGIGLFFAFWSWVGFEMAPNYGEESRDPKRIVPLSLYVSVVGLGVFYVITSWAAVSAYPTIEDGIKQAQTASSDFFIAPANAMIGEWVGVLMSYLILTGSFACGMAFHNTSARYLYSLGRERLLPASLGKTHAQYKSPYVASFTQSAIAAIIIILFWVLSGGDDPFQQAYLQVYGLMAIMGVILILAAQAIVSIAIIFYFQKNYPDEHHWWSTLVAPLISFLAQIYVIWLLLDNLSFLGGGLALAFWLPWIDLAIVVIGLVVALYLKSSNPEKFDKIGRLIYQGLEK
jgi:amino acid transporter